MDFESLYHSIIEGLKQDTRPLISLNEREGLALCQQVRQALRAGHRDREVLHRFLCILDNTQTLSPHLDQLAQEILRETSQDPLLQNLIVFTLSVLGHHVIQRRQIIGEEVPKEVFSLLQKLLFHPDPEVLEWVLRIIEMMGNKGFILREDILKRRPKFFQLFNKAQRATLEMIELLERRWAPLKKGCKDE